ncbi:MAG: hypothetical protein R3313_04585 [Candidatus Saccharimonadales bacterium]|nr:hypothetical protein [Candidatus Saccharimonadales bacterium]
MSGNVPRVVGGSVLGAAATQLPNTGPSELAVQLALFVGGFLLVWLLADLATARRSK